MRRSSTSLAVALLALVAVSQFAAAEEAAVYLHDSPARRAIEKRLAEPIDVDFENASLSDAVAFLQESTRLDLQLDHKALEEAGISPDAPVTLRIRGISLRSALNLMLRDFDMDWAIQNDVLLLTTVSQGETLIETAIYPVADLVYPPSTSESRRSRHSPDFDSLIELITATIAPTTWAEVGGQGPIHVDPRTKSLVIGQTRPAHEQIAALLADLRDVRDPQFFPDRPRVARNPRPTEVARERIEGELSREVTLEWRQTPLDKALRQLAADNKLSIVIDKKAFAEAGVAIDTAVTLHVKDVALRQALRRLLDLPDLTYVICDEVLLITTASQAETIFATRVYPARDLVESVEKTRPDYASLMELIVRELSPTTWSEVGGAGSIKAFPDAGALVISQTEKVQEKSAAFLAALRKVHREEQAVAIAPADAKEAVADAAAPDDELILVVHRLPQHLSDAYSGGMGGGMGGMFQVPAENQQPAAPAASGEEKKPADSAAPRPTHPADIMAARQAARANAARDLERIIPQVIAPESWHPPGNGSIHAFGDKLIVRQIQSIHDQIDDLLGEL